MHWVLLNLSGFEAPLKYFSVLISSKVMIFFFLWPQGMRDLSSLTRD